MSNDRSSDVYRRLQISPSKNNHLKKPALRLSPRRVYRVNDINYTPSQAHRDRISKHLTQSLDRDAKLFIPPISPTHSILSRIGENAKSERRLLQDTSNKDKSRKEITQRGPTTNLLQRLREESSRVEDNINSKDQSVSVGANHTKDKKSVKFFLPSEENLSDELGQLRQLLEHVVQRQDRLERSILDIKNELRKNNT